MAKVRAELLANVSPLLPVKLVFMSARKSMTSDFRLHDSMTADSVRVLGTMQATSNRRPGKPARILEMIKAPETFCNKIEL